MSDKVVNMHPERLVLDHGYVQLVSCQGDENSALVAARISTGNATGVDEAKDDSLRERLWKDQHTSPFEMPDLTVNLQLPLFALRQFDRHRTVDEMDGTVVESVDETARKFLSRNEFSGRYAVMPDLFYVPDHERIMGKDPKNKQGSKGPMPRDIQIEAVERIKKANQFASETYKWMVDQGIANEIARYPLPQTQYTRIQLKGSLLNWFKLLNLRKRPDVQWETRQFADAIGEIIQKIWPKSWELFLEYTFEAVTFSRSEMLMLNSALQALLDETGRYGVASAVEDGLDLKVLPYPNKKQMTQFLSKLAPELSENE